MEFWDLAEGQWSQKRLLLERDKVRKYADAARRNGTAGGRPKSLKNNDGENPAGSPGETQQKAPNPNPNPNPNKREDFACAKSLARARETLDADFEIFWSAYPHQVGKPAALAAYRAARSSGAPHDEIVEGARRYGRSKPPDRQWLNPSSFLVEQRWLDRPAPDPARTTLTVVNGVKSHAAHQQDRIREAVERRKANNPYFASRR
jgi:hypothetical protein